jgi:hypothetical protein
MFHRINSLLAIAIVFFSVSCKNQKSDNLSDNLISPDTSSGQIISRPVLLYGIPSYSFDLLMGNIKPNGFLSEILLKHGVSMQEIDQVIKNSGKVFDVKNIRAGNKYILFCDKESTARARYMVYEHDISTCYVFSFNDSLNITPFRKQIKSEIRYSTGTIETSLWDAMIYGGLHPTLAIELSDIFAWSVDFFGLQKGDNFKVIYE